MPFHVPVMVQEVVAGLKVEPGGTYVDASAGGGGHSRAILERLGPEGRLIAVDRDREAVEELSRVLADPAGRVILLNGSFAQLRLLLAPYHLQGVHGILFDLGMSSHQIEQAQRGFSYQQNGPLDMRMDPGTGIPAAELIARSSEDELTWLIREYGEERQARQVARSIGRIQQQRRLEKTEDLRSAVAAVHPSHLPKTLARVFQAFRIAVNNELGQLEEGLAAAIELLFPGGRLAVIAYHSLEDRLVKVKLAPLVRGCTCPPRVPVCTCGLRPSFRKVHPKPRRASPSEVRTNRRARSAVLRVYEKI